MTEATELAELPPAETALDVYSKPGGLDPWLDKIRAEVTGHAPDLKTKKGRDAIASLAFKVRKVKTALDGIGKEQVDRLKEIPKKIDAERKRMRETLDALADEVRAPLDQWEQAEEARQQRHQQGIEWFRLRADENRDLDADELRATIADVQARAVDESWEEFEPEAHRVKARALEALQQALAAREKHDADQAELAELRRKQAEQDQKDRDARIAQEAADKAKREAEEKASADKAEAERRELELKLQAEQAEKAAAQAKADKLAAEQRAEQDRLAAIEREKQAVEDARQAEIKRQADAKAAEEAEAARREADKVHKGKVNRAALDAFVAGGMPEDCAKQAVTLIAKGLIPNIRITY
ncbi:hypothetical protein LMG7053_05914 [Achromobacter ruhlandii]|uniref:Cell envelope biogenesis protein TolA n=1 Tax=Achromobacter ruhlandii TaxID=72557 RepID=A0ABM8M3W4_9BURK|nr:hypothetical protein [Achromobacter ruhlandii]CAB3959416.1 hypothetical protein LMG7053_05914 [Achromobacter ruhlandii]